MRIIHTCLRYPPATGGVEKYVSELVNRTQLRSSGFAGQALDVRVLSSKLRTHGPISELDPELLLDNPAYVQRLHVTETPLISYPRLQALNYYLGHHQPDIVHGHSFWYQPADVAARYAKKNNIPFIFSPYYYNHKTRQKLIWQLYKNTVGRATFAAADVVAVISPQEQKLIEADGFPVKRFELLPPGVDVEKFSQLRENVFREKDISGKILLSVGRIDKNKGLEDVIKSLPEIRSKIPDVQYAIVGEDFGNKDTLIALTKKLGVENIVHFLGKLKEPELIGAYQHADVFLHTSHYEAFGIVLAESLAAGTPVVARDVGAVSYVVPPEKAGLLFKSQAELVTNVVDVLRNKNKANTLAAFGRKHVTENFTWNKTIKKLTSLYEELSQS